MRDIADYAMRYQVPGFEGYKVRYRRKKVLEIINQYHPEKILEIGCGMEPLFQFEGEIQYTIIEPSCEFYDNAVKLSQGMGNVRCIQGFFEDVCKKLNPVYDMVVCSALLHEVENPDCLLKNISRVCNEDTIVHINVPNACSMHRLLGTEMGILKNQYEQSAADIDFQHNSVFDRKSLEDIVRRNGMDVVEGGAFFVKPFSHKQMYQMLEGGIIDEAVLDGLYELGKVMPEFCSEIYVNCKVKAGSDNDK